MPLLSCCQKQLFHLFECEYCLSYNVVAMNFKLLLHPIVCVYTSKSAGNIVEEI